MNQPQKTVFVVHCIDTEGPLCETLEATFERLKNIFGITLDPTSANLGKLQKRQLQLHGQEDQVATVFAPELLAYNDSWDKIRAMLGRIMAPEFRLQMRDSFGNGWVYNWHCVDHVGYETNMRGRELGFNAIFDRYRGFMDEFGAHAFGDRIHWHFHPVSPHREAHICATSYLNSKHLLEIICRRLIDREWFPVVNRAGFHAERPDSHWFLEQWIPFDLSNQALESDGTSGQRDATDGRFGDWRLAPRDWSIYHPSHDCYQIPGNCRRFIGRCLNVGTRFRLLSQEEVNKAFARADSGLPTVLAFTDHDFRDIGRDVDTVRGLLAAASANFRDVRFRFSEAASAMRSAIFGEEQIVKPLQLELSVEKLNPDFWRVQVYTVNGKVFGPQPFLAVKTRNGMGVEKCRYFHDNFDFSVDLNSWSYTLDVNTFLPAEIDTIAVASNDEFGNTWKGAVHMDEQR